jgi:hypothetical protein
MDVGREAVGFVERADANEANCVTGSGVVAPKAIRTPGTA